MRIPDFRLAYHALEENEIDRADLVRLLSVFDNWHRGDLNITCAEILAREFRVDATKIRHWEAELAGQPSSRIGPYQLRRRIGQGGMGVVYEAGHSNFDRPVALKILTPARRDPTAIQLFLREVKSAGRFNHPSIVHAYDAGIDGDIPYLAMEYVDGENLFQILLGDGVISAEQATDWLAQATGALWFLEAMGWTHGDGKPSNWVVTQHGTLKLIDLGLCRPPGRPRHPELIHGSPPYIAPEQLGVRPRGGSAAPANGARQRIDIRADLFSLGATFFHLLTGRPPYEARTAAQLITAFETQTPPSLATLRPDLPKSLAVLLEKLIEQDMERRFRDCEELAQAIERLPNGPKVVRPPTTSEDRHETSSPRRPRPVWRVAVVVCAISCIFAGAWAAHSYLRHPVEESHVDDVAPRAADGDAPIEPPEGLEPSTAEAIESAWNELWTREPRPFPALFRFVGTHADQPQADDWRERMRVALLDEAEPLWTSLEGRVTAEIEGGHFQIARERLAEFPARLRLGKYRLAFDRVADDIVRSQQATIAAWIRRLEADHGAQSALRTQLIYRSLYVLDPADRDVIIEQIDRHFGGRPWLAELEREVADAFAAKAARRDELERTVAVGALPSPRWEDCTDPVLEWVAEIVRAHPDLVLDRQSGLVERLLDAGLLGAVDPGYLGQLIAILDPEGSSGLTVERFRLEHRAAALWQQAMRACQGFEVEPAEAAWRRLAEPEFRETFVAQYLRDHGASYHRALVDGARLRSGLLVADIQGAWQETPTLIYDFSKPETLTEWRHRGAHWHGDQSGLRCEETSPLELFVPIDGPVVFDVSLRLPTRDGKPSPWFVRFEHSDHWVGISSARANELVVATGEHEAVTVATLECRGRPVLGARVVGDRLRVRVALTADTMVIGIGGREHRETLEWQPTIDWVRLEFGTGVTLERAALTGMPSSDWLEKRAAN